MADSSAVTTTSHSSSSILSLVLDAFAAVFSFIFSIHWSLRLYQLFSLVALPFRLILHPLRFIAGILLTLFAPAIYFVSFGLSGVRALASFLASLEPLYTFFGAAAGVGIFAGIVIAISSSLITSQLGIQDDEGDDASTERSSSKHSYLQDSQGRRDSSSTELEWQWLDSPSHRRRPAAGLLSQTIHEEDDDSEY
ncbi:hypothetical protein G7Z17_g8444 [Cylindrodendrum hubeiense]|uniref:Uncharacterized protein n=1 Tax=Cylindrodendrum hubeiense TaxID=595255 RepID=A0A9P5H5Y8_9HYPO|nr:hypothetical protein G7Z17_g8444 [Cylindrodendrum hubeiense]